MIVPGWFNSIQVKQYKFYWKNEGTNDYIQTGSLDYGEYGKMFLQYDLDDFSGCEVVSYRPFDGEGAYNGLKGDTTRACFVAAALLIIAEVYIIDSYVSYNRGRGFLTSYGHHVHTYGRTNPHYVRAREKHMARSRSGGCACACAGGGRAGCSQKDTYGSNN